MEIFKLCIETILSLNEIGFFEYFFNHMAGYLALIINSILMKKIKYDEYTNINKSHQSQEKVDDATSFINEQSERKAYLLGLFWADGYIRKNGSTIALELVTSDYDSIKEIFAGWKVYHRHREGRQPQTQVILGNAGIWNFLTSLDFINKSTSDPNKVLEHLNPELHNHFWRGFLDGDGNIYHKGNTKQVSFYGAYEQSWHSLKSLLEGFDAKYYYKTYIRESGKWSVIKLSNSHAIKTFCEYIYRDATIYLNRKCEKYEEMRVRLQ